MKILVKNTEGQLAELHAINGLIPEGWEVVSQDDISKAELTLAREAKLSQIRAKRDAMLKINDREWMIAKKMNQPTDDIEADAQKLRMAPQTAQTELNKKRSVNTIKAYDVFVDLELARSYEE